MLLTQRISDVHVKDPGQTAAAAHRIPISMSTPRMSHGWKNKDLTDRPSAAPQTAIDTQSEP